MRKILILFSIGMIAYSLPFAHATTSHKKHHKKIKHMRKSRHDVKQEMPRLETQKNTEATTETNKKFQWLDGMSGNFALTSNYVFRGVSQSENLPAVQGGFTYTFPIGLYLNAWGSNVRFTGGTASIELDSIIGWRGGVGEDFAYDVNYARYNYPRARELEYNELNSVFNYRFLQAGLSYSGNVYNKHVNGTYYSGGVNYNIPPKYVFNLEDMNILALYGHYSLAKLAGNSYNDYNITLSKKISPTYTLALQWTNTNGRYNNPPFDNRHLIATLTANF